MMGLNVPVGTGFAQSSSPGGACWRKASQRRSTRPAGGSGLCARAGAALTQSLATGTAAARPLGSWRSQRGRRRAAQQLCSSERPSYTVENVELLVGDCVALYCFCLYKQITSLVLSPSFEGWLAPLHFNPLRFAEFFSFALTLGGSWAACALLLGGYRYSATSTLPATLSLTSRIWLGAMLLAAAQLVLSTSAESRSLVGGDGFASVLPLAVTGPGEPFATASGVLGLMCLWRSCYSVYWDIWNWKPSDDDPIDRRNGVFSEAYHLQQALSLALGMALASVIALQVLHAAVREEDAVGLASAVSDMFFPAGQ